MTNKLENQQLPSNALDDRIEETLEGLRSYGAISIQLGLHHFFPEDYAAIVEHRTRSSEIDAQKMLKYYALNQLLAHVDPALHTVYTPTLASIFKHGIDRQLQDGRVSREKLIECLKTKLSSISPE